MAHHEDRKAKIRRRLTLGRYARSSAAKFTDDNDHNPIVLQDCPLCHEWGLCHGWGAVCEHSTTGTTEPDGR